MPALTVVQLRRGTSSQWSASTNVLSQGEVGYDLSLKKIKIGDGTSLWDSLPWATVIGSDLVGTSGINISYAANSGTATVSVTGLTSSYLSDFATAVSGLLPVKEIIAGNNITVTPTGDKGFVISSPVNENTVKDIIGSTITGTSGINFSYDNTAKTAVVSVTGLTSSFINNFNSSVSGLLEVKSLSQGSGIGISNVGGNHTISVTGIPSSVITDLSNVATTDVIGRTGVALSYDSAADKLYIDATGVSFDGHTHSWNNITDASAQVSLTELSYLSGVVPGTVSAGRSLVVDSSKNLTGINHLTTTGDAIIGGNLTVQGTTTTVNSTTVDIGDNIIRVNASGLASGGLEVYSGSQAYSIVWNSVNNRWEFSGGNVYTSGSFIGSLSGNATTVTNGVYTTDVGTVTSTMIADNTIVNADINSSAAIAYSKLNLSSSIVNTDISNSAAISDSKLANITTAGKVANSATTATDTNTPSAIVSRDANGNFSAGTITGNLSGNASTVTNGVYTTDTGTVTSTMIADNTIVNADINANAGIVYSKLNLASGIVNNDVSASAAIAYSKLNLSSSIVDADISSNAAIAVAKLAASGMTFGSTVVNLGQSTSVLNGLTAISGVSMSSPTVLTHCVIDGGTP